MLWRSMTDEQLSQLVQNIPRVQLPLNTDRQALPGELVDYTEHTEHYPIMGTILNEVIRPNMTFVSWPEANA